MTDPRDNDRSPEARDEGAATAAGATAVETHEDAESPGSLYPATDDPKDGVIATQAELEHDLSDPDPRHVHEAEENHRVLARLSPALTLLLGLAATAIAIGFLRGLKDIVAPTFLAVTLIIAVYPLYRRLDRWLPAWLAATLLVLMLYGILILLAGALGLAATLVAQELGKPEYTQKFTELVDKGQVLLARYGVEQQQLDSAMQSFDIRQLGGLASQVVSTLTNTTTTMLFLLTVMLFLAMDSGGVVQRLRGLHALKPDIADALVDFGRRVRTYWVVSTVFGLIVAVLDGIALRMLGVPLVLAMVILAFVTNYIPNIGFVIGLVPPAVLALVANGPMTALWVVVIYSLLNFTIQSVLQPKFTGDAVGINATTAFLSLVFWGWVFGGLGALLAIPLTLFVKSLLIDRDPTTAWINQFIAADPPKKQVEGVAEAGGVDLSGERTHGVSASA